MEVDIQVLRDRISRLEFLLGPPPSSNTPCIHVRAKNAQAALRNHIPDEMAAAHRAVVLLSHATPSLRGLQHARQTRAADAEDAVDRAAAALQEMEAVQDGLRLDGDSLRVDAAVEEELHSVNRRLADEAMPAVEDEERALDALLIDFNDATARLNSRIIALAGAVRMAKEEDA